MVADMGVVDKQKGSGDAVEDYSMAFIPSMPVPPYFLEVSERFDAWVSERLDHIRALGRGGDRGSTECVTWPESSGLVRLD